MRTRRTAHAQSPAPFQIRGEIDLANAADLVRQLEQYAATTTGNVVVDCRHMTFIDSSGLQALIKVQQRLDDLGRRLVIERLRRNCSKIFEIGGLDTLFGTRTG